MIKQILIAIDQLFNTFFYGMADETLSARAWRNSHKKHWGIMMYLIDSIFFWQDNHCYNSFLRELNRDNLPREYQ